MSSLYCAFPRLMFCFKALCEPKDVFLCEGGKAEYDKLCNQMVADGSFIKLNQKKRPGCYLALSDPKVLVFCCLFLH